MGKHNYNIAKVLNKAAIIGNVNAPANITKKKAISTSDTFNAGQDYRNQQGYRLPGLDWIYHIPSPGKAYNKMSEAQQLLFWTTLGCIGGIALGEYVTKGPYKDTAKKTYEKLFTKSSGKAVVVAPAVVANGSAAVTPTATPAPSYDYYDEEFKVGIVIGGDHQFKQNVTNLIETFKQVTPDDYNDLIKYAPKNIVRSKDAYNWYSLGSDTIQLPESSEKLGGSKDLKTRLLGVLQLVPEFGNAKQYKTGVTFNSVYDSELDANVRKAKYAVKIGLWTQAYADNYIKDISEKIKNGTYYDGAKLNQS